MQIVRKKLAADQVTPGTIRYNPDCDCVEQTWDGGTTWTPTPGADPRSSPAFRAPALTGGTAQCDAAANMVAGLQQMVAGDISADGQAMLATYLLGVALLFVPAAGWIADVFLLIAEGILLLDQATIEAAFTSTVYDDLLCTFFDRLDADGQMSDAQLTGFLEDVFTNYDFTVYSVVSNHSDALGAVGWSNIGALGTETGDCDDCSHWCVIFDFRTGAHGFTYQYTDSVGNLTGAGWETSATGEDSGDPAVQAQDVYISRDLTGATLTNITAQFRDGVPGTFISAPTGAYASYLIVNGAFVGDTPAPSGDFTINLDVSSDAGILGAFSRMGYNVSAGAPGGNVVLESITLTGTGDKPTGGDDC